MVPKATWPQMTATFSIDNPRVLPTLTVVKAGTGSGSVTSTDQVITITVPLTTTTVTGFFFAAEVADSQDPAATQTAIFVLPTIPVG